LEPARNYFPKMIEIRRYQPDDNHIVKELHYAGIAQMVELIPEEERLVPPPEDEHFIDSDLDDIEGAYINNRGDFLVGLEAEEMVVIGAIRKATETCGELKRLRVRRDRQRRGYGEAMILRLIDRGRELGYRELILDTLESNLPAQRLFEGLGFIELRRESLGPFKLVIYGKKLNEGSK
jgi:ribosomal protein S18 acetylase RimI-like enzyme